MTFRWRFLATLMFLSLVVCTAGAQERGGVPGADAKDTPPPGVDKFYFDLSKSKDRSTKSLAERYISMVKAQEWSDLSGNFKTVARYVKHTPDLTTVTIEVIKGRGAEQKSETKTVPVDKLSKSCQSRVRQINAMQKKLQEVAAAMPGENGLTPGSPGAPMVDERGVEPGATAGVGPEGGPAAVAAEAAPDPSASEPDPLGFAELPDATVPPAGDAIPPEAVPANPADEQR